MFTCTQHQFSLICVALLLTAARQTLGGLDEQSNRQIKLEDIERDNLVSEQTAKDKERGVASSSPISGGGTGSLLTQQTQHLRPPSIYSQTDFQHEQRGHEHEEADPQYGNGNEDYDEQQQQHHQLQQQQQDQQTQYIQGQQDQQTQYIQGGIEYETVAPESYSHQPQQHQQHHQHQQGQFFILLLN